MKSLLQVGPTHKGDPEAKIAPCARDYQDRLSPRLMLLSCMPSVPP